MKRIGVKMEIVRLLICLIFGLTLSNGIEKTGIYIEADIIEDSEIGYILTPGGFSLNNDPNKFKYFLVCKKYNVYKVFGHIWHDGRSKYTYEKISLRKYLNLWRTLQKFDIWNMESKDPTIMLPAESEKLLEIYKDLRLEKSTYEFFFRIKDSKHKFTIYDITALKDANYLSMLKEINKLFGIKEILE